MANWVQQDWTRTLTKANQASIIGNSRPPNMANVKPDMLTAASPKYFNLQQATGVDTTPSDNAANFCRTTYTGFSGLRKLQQDQANRTYYDSGCGWRFNMGPGTGNPTINQGALGSYNGPVYGGTGDLDEVANSTTWDMNLQRAERNASTTLATNLNNKCENLQYLSTENQQFFGFCTSSGAIIPIQTDAQGNVTARFATDITLGCPSANIIPATKAPGSCPASASASASAKQTGSKQGFTNYPNRAGSDLRQGMGVKGDLLEAFSQKKKLGSDSVSEGFGDTYTSINDLRQCKSPLTSDCVVLAARAAGCGNEGSLITALQGIPKGMEYNKNLQNNQAYIAYTQAANPGITPNLLKDGSVSLATALTDFGNILTNAQSKNPKVASASRDLCIQSGYFEDSYDWCADMSPSSTIDSTNIACVQNNWGNQGGTDKGTGYPTLTMWQGKTFQSFLSFVKTLLMNTESSDKATQDMALLQLIGTSSAYTSITKTVNVTGPSPMPAVSQTNGGETVWIDIGDYWNGSTPPVILRCDLMMAVNGEIIPEMLNDYKDITAKYNMPSLNGIAFMNAFEYRPSSDTSLQFQVTSDDGFMIGLNQNPFENTVNAKNDWGSWAYQAPTTFTSGNYAIKSDTTKNTNTIITKYFEGQGGAHFKMLINDGAGVWKDPAKDYDIRGNMFLTQEPLAPWLQYELCSRPNADKGNSVGFFEKRWNGPSAYYENKGINSPVPSFDVTSKNIVTQTDPKLTSTVPGSKGYITFSPGSSWNTQALFAFTAFQTITLLVRPQASLSSGTSASIFNHSSMTSGAGFNTSVWLMNMDGKNYQFKFFNGSSYTYLPCVLNQWNLIIIQYNSDSKGIHNVQADAMDLPTAQTSGGQQTLLARIMNHQSVIGPVIMPPITNEAQRTKGAGQVFLGASASQMSFTGDIAWLHGFRTPINTSGMLEAEINQSWLSRWPRPNLDSGFAPAKRDLVETKPNCISSAGTGITIYENCDARGWSRQLPVGEYDNTVNAGSFPSDVSYIKVPAGFKATIFTGSLDNGKSKSFEGPTQWSFCNEGWWANDKIKSIRVEPSAGNQCYKPPIGSDTISRNPMLIRALDIDRRPSSEVNEKSSDMRYLNNKSEGFLGSWFSGFKW